MVWDDHGTRCGVCLEIAAQSILDLRDGMSIKDIRTKVDEKYKSVIKMHLILQFSLKEIADMKGMEYSTVRSLYSRGIRKLRNSCLSLEEGGSDE